MDQAQSKERTPPKLHVGGRAWFDFLKEGGGKLAVRTSRCGTYLIGPFFGLCAGLCVLGFGVSAVCASCLRSQAACRPNEALTVLQSRLKTA